MFPGEKESIEATLKAGAEYGYGNLIHHLQVAWARMLMERYEMSEESAYRAAFRPDGPLLTVAEMDRRLKWAGIALVPVAEASNHPGAIKKDLESALLMLVEEVIIQPQKNSSDHEKA